MGMFSPNEEIKEIATENIKLIMAPFYKADLLFRIMDSRFERVKMAHVFYLEYLKLLDHYGVLEKDQKAKVQLYVKKHKVAYQMERKDAQIDDLKEAQEMQQEILAMKPSVYEDRESKIAEFRLKKLIETQLDDLKNYRDEEMKREFYMMQIRQSVMTSFEQLRLIEMEVEILKHQATLSAEQIATNEKKSARPPPGSLPPMQMEHITVSSFPVCTDPNLNYRKRAFRKHHT